MDLGLDLNTVELVVVQTVEEHGRVVLVLQQSGTWQKQQCLVDFGRIWIGVRGNPIKVPHNQGVVVHKVQLGEGQA